MPEQEHRSMMMGALIGLGVAGCIGLLSWLGWLTGLVNFLSALPMFITWRLAAGPSVLEPVIFCTYWILLGGILGKLARRNTSNLVIILVFVILLLFAHRKAQVSWERNPRVVDDILMVGE